MTGTGRLEARHGPASCEVRNLRTIAADLAVFATFAAVLVLFAISPTTLESLGIPYLTAGGGIFAKVHPATVLVLTALALRCFAARRPLRVAWRQATEDEGAILMLSATSITALYAITISHTPVTPLIDTFVLPVLLFLLLRDVNPVVTRRLALVVCSAFCVNAVLSVLEITQHMHFPSISVAADVSPDPRRGNATFDWRAQLANDPRAVALFGHPLTDGLLTGALLICFVARGSRWFPPILKAPICALQIVAMGTFGARSAFVLTILAVLFLCVQYCVDAVREGKRVSQRTVAVALLGLILLVVVAFVLAASGLLDQTIDRIQSDNGSASTRITMFDMFDPFSWSDIMFGPNPDVVATQQRLLGLEFGIESSWVGLTLTYGLVVTTILLTGLAAFSHSLIRASGPGAGLLLIYFFMLVSVAASISTKTTVFAMMVIVILLFLRRDLDQGFAYRKSHEGIT